MEQYYSDALKQALKYKKACAARGEAESLPVLDEILKDKKSTGETSLGVMQIPMELIVGTKTAGRANLFAPNFLPLAPEQSEFAVKWERLCLSHLDEGIRDPIKAYEYRNRYYVAEGNKRVSVLRYFGAVSVYAQVMGIPSEQDGSPEAVKYEALKDFYRVSGIRRVEFSRPESYGKLLDLMGKSKDEVWTDQERSRFLSDYDTFRRAYETMAGKLLPATPADALLAYLEIYGYEDLRGTGFTEIKKRMAKAWEDISLLQEETPISVRLDPEDKKPGLLTKVFSGGEPGLLTKVLSGGEGKLQKVAFIHDAAPETSSWTRGHERGREYVQRVLGESLETAAYCNALDKDPLTVIEEAVEQGNTTVFTTSPRLMPAALRAAVEHPEVTVFNCSLNQSHRYIRTYYARMYEAKFIIGAIAGALADGKTVGYICDYPIFGQIAGINAFALGVQMTNPHTRVELAWSSVSDAGETVAKMQEKGIRLISTQDQVRRGAEGEFRGLSLFGDGDPVRLATPLWQWGTYYEEILRRVRSLSAKEEYSGSSKALNYYWGMSAGVVSLQCTEKVPQSTRKLAAILRESIRSGVCDPFRGPLYTRDGKILENNEMLTPEQIINMDYLMENVEGEIPRYDELTEAAKATVDVVGVASASKEKKDER